MTEFSGDLPVAASKQSESETAKIRKKDDLDERQTPTIDGKPKVPAWQLREMMKAQSRPTYKPKTVSRTPHRNEGGVDPSLPPAFRAAVVRQRKKEIDDFMSLESVHSSKTQPSMLTANDSTSDLDSDSFSGQDSFASLGEEEDDDEAYREGRNQMARQTIECSESNTKKNYDFRLRKGVLGMPLDFIAE